MLKPAILQRVIGMQFLHFESRPVVETSLMVYASGLVVSRRKVVLKIELCKLQVNMYREWKVEMQKQALGLQTDHPNALPKHQSNV